MKPHRRVIHMHPGETATIVSFTDDHLANKLMEMGFLPGAMIRFHFRAPLGDPICVSVSGYDLALRYDEASGIQIGERCLSDHSV